MNSVFVQLWLTPSVKVCISECLDGAGSRLPIEIIDLTSCSNLQRLAMPPIDTKDNKDGKEPKDERVKVNLLDPAAIKVGTSCRSWLTRKPFSTFWTSRLAWFVAFLQPTVDSIATLPVYHGHQAFSRGFLLQQHSVASWLHW